ncbi:hypothetical protein EE612_000146 [Oryza sativa]|nr:hypothetical protein EE612_000146 [Oryza sativa]
MGISLSLSLKVFH